jgi:GNAT superfamily N-acetyltransferase
MMTDCRIIEESIDVLPEYGRVPIAFEVRTMFDVKVIDNGLGGFLLSERKVDPPYVKDYDSVEKERSTSWAGRWDISNWGVISAFLDDSRVGGGVIAYDTPGVTKLEGRKDIAALWDIRVQPEFRRKGIGSSLFAATVLWAAQRSCRLLKVETQNINVPACRFYVKQGCVLGTVNRFAYDEFPDEVELIWYKEL